MVLPRIVKPKTHTGQRALERKEPKILENPKMAMFIKGGNTSGIVTNTLKELYQLKTPNALMYKRKNIIRPFENEISLEFFSQRSDASLFVFGCHSKKKPHDIIFGRMFDYHLLDMIELGIEEFKSMSEFESAKVPIGTKPCLLFAGDPFDQDEEYRRLKNIFIDFFGGPIIDNVRLAGLEHVIMITAVDGKIHLRNYSVLLKKSGCRVPRIELDEIGPALDFVMRRSRLASADLYKRACQVPKAVKVTKRKNISHDAFRSKLGRIHMERQDYSKLQTRKLKGLKKKQDSIVLPPKK